MYYNQRKNVRQIAQEARISFRDISAILKKKVNDVSNGTGNGIGVVDNRQQQQQGDDNNNKSPNEKATEAYKLFSEGKKPVQVAIELGLREKQVNKLFRGLWKLKRVDKLYEIYPQIEHYLPSFLKLHKALKKRGLNLNNVKWFADGIETGAIKIPEIQKEYAKVKEELEAIDHKKTISKHQLNDMYNQITLGITRYKGVKDKFSSFSVMIYVLDCLVRFLFLFITSKISCGSCNHSLWLSEMYIQYVTC